MKGGRGVVVCWFLYTVSSSEVSDTDSLFLAGDALGLASLKRLQSRLVWGLSFNLGGVGRETPVRDCRSPRRVAAGSVEWRHGKRHLLKSINLGGSDSQIGLVVKFCC